MSSEIGEEVVLKALLKHPKMILVYAAFLGLGWLAKQLVPSETQKEMERWQALYYHSERRCDSVNASTYKMALENAELKSINRSQGQTIKQIDSLLIPLGKKAKEIIKKSGHEH